MLYRKLHEREMNKRIMHQPSYRRLRRAHPARLDRYNEMQDTLYFTKKGYGLRRVLLESGVLVSVITKGLPLTCRLSPHAELKKSKRNFKSS